MKKGAITSDKTVAIILAVIVLVMAVGFIISLNPEWMARFFPNLDPVNGDDEETIAGLDPCSKWDMVTVAKLSSVQDKNGGNIIINGELTSLKYVSSGDSISFKLDPTAHWRDDFSIGTSVNGGYVKINPEYLNEDAPIFVKNDVYYYTKNDWKTIFTNMGESVQEGFNLEVKQLALLDGSRRTGGYFCKPSLNVISKYTAREPATKILDRSVLQVKMLDGKEVAAFNPAIYNYTVIDSTTGKTLNGFAYLWAEGSNIDSLVYIYFKNTDNGEKFPNAVIGKRSGFIYDFSPPPKSSNLKVISVSFDDKTYYRNTVKFTQDPIFWAVAVAPISEDGVKISSVIGPYESILSFKPSDATTPLYYLFDEQENIWRWSPDMVNWMSVEVLVVSGGTYNGKSPTKLSQERIIQLRGLDEEAGKALFN